MACVRTGGAKEIAAIVLLVCAQAFFWYGVPGGGDDRWWKGTRDIKPDLGVVPPVPSDVEFHAFSFGDDEFYFRTRAFQIQNAGDTFGRVTALKDYDFSALLKWWILLDSLDTKSDYIPSMASYYFSATQEPKRDVPYIADYLEQHADRDPEAKWWWYGQAAFLAYQRGEDRERALRIGEKLAALPKTLDIPLWTRQFNAFIHEEAGEYDQACAIILQVLDGFEDLSEGEMNFIYHFIEDRIKAMDNLPADTVIDPRCKALHEAQKAKES